MTDSNPLLKLEAHKPVIRGILIKHGSRIKKERKAETTRLLTDIARLEPLHKRANDTTIRSKLTALRTQLNDLYSHKAKAALTSWKKDYYEHGNMCGKILATSLRKQRLRTYVPWITSRVVGKIFHPKDIVNAFKEYHTALYALPDTLTSTPSRHELETYISSSGMPKLPQTTEIALDAPLSQE